MLIWLFRAKPICLRLFMQEARRPDSRAALMAGNNRATRMPMMAITTSNSTSVNPTLRCLFNLESNQMLRSHALPFRRNWVNR